MISAFVFQFDVVSEWYVILYIYFFCRSLVLAPCIYSTFCAQFALVLALTCGYLTQAQLIST